MIEKDILFINDWPNSVRPLDKFLPELKQRTVLVSSLNIANDFLKAGWECIPVEEHSWENYLRTVLPAIRHLPIRHVIADSELHLLPAAYLREALCIPGQSIASARSYRNKIEMLGFVKGASTFRVPDYIDLGESDPIEIRDFCSKHNPIIVKPVEGTDSKGVRLLTEEQLFHEFYESMSGYLAQEYIPYTVYHVDGLLVRGEISFFSLCKYFKSCFEYSSGAVMGSEFVWDKHLLERFGAAIREALTLMPTPFNTTFHAEFFYDEANDDLVFCEIASRTGGACGALAALVDYEYGINLPREMILANIEKDYVAKHYQRRSDDITAVLLLIPNKCVKKLQPKSLGNLVYFLDSSRNEVEKGSDLSTDGAVKLVYAAPINKIESRRQELISLITIDTAQ